MFRDDGLAAAIGKVQAAERAELLAQLAAARREPDPAVRERLLAEIPERCAQYRLAESEWFCTEIRLRREALLRQLTADGESAVA